MDFANKKCSSCNRWSQQMDGDARHHGAVHRRTVRERRLRGVSSRASPLSAAMDGERTGTCGITEPFMGIWDGVWPFFVAPPEPLPEPLFAARPLSAPQPSPRSTTTPSRSPSQTPLPNGPTTRRSPFNGPSVGRAYTLRSVYEHNTYNSPSTAEFGGGCVRPI